MAENMVLLERVRQCDLLDESKFLSWAKSLGVDVFGVVRGDLQEFWHRGWVRCEEFETRPKEWEKRMNAKTRHFHTDDRKIGEKWQLVASGMDHVALFHPFRIFPVYEAVKSLELNWAPSSMLHDGFSERISKSILQKQSALAGGGLIESMDLFNGIADVAIMLEPLFWPWVTSVFRGRSFTSDTELEDLHEKYRALALEFVAKLDVEALRHGHELLRTEAAIIEDNGDLYRLLRSANWDTRKNLKGEIGLSLWLRHMAEVMRRGVEEAHGIQLEEEDVAFGMWYPGGRERFYGAERALDYPSYFRKDLLHRMGLDVSVRVYWYVEGQTEVGYLRGALGGVRDSQVEVVNCKGKFCGAALDELFEDLRRDIAAERFSLVSADRDVEDNIKAIQRMAANDLIVGYIPIYEPDFEFANFSIEELVAAAVHLDEHSEVPVDSSLVLAVEKFVGVGSGKEFDKRYQELHSGTRRPLKGFDWGLALWETTKESGAEVDGKERPVLAGVRMVHRSALVVHKDQRARFRMDPETLKLVERSTGN
ncbi:MAG: hypothetical protein WD716_13045 [Fimbriimonadaceae bacterium]